MTRRTTALAGRHALFLDRDGTLIKDVHYLRDPADVELIPGAAAAVRRLAEVGFVPVVITNQSGIARGLLTEADYEAVDARMDALLAAEGVVLAGAYHCPHHPEFPYQGVTRCDCRKPGTRLHERAIADLGLDTDWHLAMGDRWRDVEPALRLGWGAGFLIPSADTPHEEVELARTQLVVCASLAEAASLVLEQLEG